MSTNPMRPQTALDKTSGPGPERPGFRQTPNKNSKAQKKKKKGGKKRR